MQKQSKSYITASFHSVLEALGAAEARRALGSPSGPWRWQPGARTVWPAERRDLHQESFNGSGLCPPHWQEAPVAGVRLHLPAKIPKFVSVWAFSTHRSFLVSSEASSDCSVVAPAGGGAGAVPLEPCSLLHVSPNEQAPAVPPGRHLATYERGVLFCAPEWTRELKPQTGLSRLTFSQNP